MSENRTEITNTITKLENTSTEDGYVISTTQARLERRLNFDLPRLYFQEKTGEALSGLILQFLDISRPYISTAIREDRLTQVHTKPVEDFDKLASKTVDGLWKLAVDYTQSDPKYLKVNAFETIVGIIDKLNPEKAKALRQLQYFMGNSLFPVAGPSENE